ncbi:MAG: DUF2871 family protein [Merdibacter sp.]
MRRFLILYNLSLPLFILTLLARGIVQVLQVPLSSAANASLSGIAGISHILLTIALGLFFHCSTTVRKRCRQRMPKAKTNEDPIKKRHAGCRFFQIRSDDGRRGRDRCGNDPIDVHVSWQRSYRAA